MDIITHAVVGAITGNAFGHPVIGALAAIAPDIVLGVKRKACPNVGYNCTHSIVYMGYVVGLVALTMPKLIAATILFAWLSHIVLDMPTHGKTWAPPLLYPIRNTRYSFGSEWEFFNPSWYVGLFYSITWSIVWLVFQSS